MKDYRDGLEEGIVIGKSAVLNVVERSVNSKMDAETIVDNLKRYLEMRDK
jgi:hypothetical protein